MLHIHLIALGKLKENYWREAEGEYTKRLGAFVKLTIHELKEESFSEKDSPEIIKEKEATKIKTELEKIPESYIIALDERGKQFSSLELSQKIFGSNPSLYPSPIRGGTEGGVNTNNITMVIGGPLGLDRTILEKANLNLSLSPLTFTHQMARVILLEQIYRAMMINNKRKYHY